MKLHVITEARRMKQLGLGWNEIASIINRLLGLKLHGVNLSVKVREHYPELGEK